MLNFAASRLSHGECDIDDSILTPPKWHRCEIMPSALRSHSLAPYIHEPMVTLSSALFLISRRRWSCALQLSLSPELCLQFSSFSHGKYTGKLCNAGTIARIVDGARGSPHLGTSMQRQIIICDCVTITRRHTKGIYETIKHLSSWIKILFRSVTERTTSADAVENKNDNFPQTAKWTRKHALVAALRHFLHYCY